MVGKAFSGRELNARETPSSCAAFAVQSGLPVATGQRQAEAAELLRNPPLSSMLKVHDVETVLQVMKAGRDERGNGATGKRSVRPHLARSECTTARDGRTWGIR